MVEDDFTQATETIHAWASEDFPQIRHLVGNVDTWDADSLIRSWCLLRGYARDSAVRLCGILPPPADVDLEWWRHAVAEPADTRVLEFWNNPTALARLLVATRDDMGVRFFLTTLLAFYIVSVEHFRRLEATAVGRAMRAIYYLPADARLHPGRRALLQILREREETETPSARLEGFFAFFKRQRAQDARHDAEEYRALAVGPLARIRSVNAPQWDAVAGDLLVEDIRLREQGIGRAHLAPNLDERSQWAARDAKRERERREQASKRGGPGYSWRCDCPLAHPWSSRECLLCGTERPDQDTYAPAKIPLDEEEIPDEATPTPEEQAIAGQQDAVHKLQLAQIERRLPPKVLAAFRLRAEGASDEDAADQVGLDARTLRRWRDRIKPQD